VGADFDRIADISDLVEPPEGLRHVDRILANARAALGRN
jgi:hypothetical protein